MAAAVAAAAVAVLAAEAAGEEARAAVAAPPWTPAGAVAVAPLEEADGDHEDEDSAKTAEDGAKDDGEKGRAASMFAVVEKTIRSLAVLPEFRLI